MLEKVTNLFLRLSAAIQTLPPKQNCANLNGICSRMIVADSNPIESAAIPCSAAPEVKAVLESMGRTEDIAFSPGHRWVAIAGFANNKLYLYATNLTCRDNAKLIDIQNYIVIRSCSLREPHGVSFLDNENIIVANRSGLIEIFEIPDLTGLNTEMDATPIATIKSTRNVSVESPGSIDFLKIGTGVYRVLVCNNYIHTVTAHKVELGRFSIMKTSLSPTDPG